MMTTTFSRLILHKALFGLVFFMSVTTFSETSHLPQAAKNQESKNQDDQVRPPKLAQDEYALFIEDKYIKFKTKEFEGLELDLVCFKSERPQSEKSKTVTAKNEKPECEAYEFSQIKPKSMKMRHEGLNNLAAIVCESVFGRNLIALDHLNNEYNFCRFKDGSMVNSWSLYYKHFPQKNKK